MPGAHQIHPHALARADQVTQRLLLALGHPDRMQLPRQKQPDQMLGVSPVSLHPVAQPARDLRRRRHHIVHAPLGELAREPVPGRAGLIRNPYRSRQLLAERDRPLRLAAHRKAPQPQLPGLGVQDRRDDLHRVHVQADEGSSLRHGWFLQYAVVDRRAGTSRAAEHHPHHRGGTGPFLHPRPDDAQSILSNPSASIVREDVATTAARHDRLRSASGRPRTRREAVARRRCLTIWCPTMLVQAKRCR